MARGYRAVSLFRSDRAFIKRWCWYRGTSLDDHLGDARAAEGLAPDEGLALDAGEQVAESGDGEDHSGHNQGGSSNRETEPLYEGHGTVGAGAHVVRRDLADRGVEGGRGRADSQEKRHLDEEDDERRYPRKRGGGKKGRRSVSRSGHWHNLPLG